MADDLVRQAERIVLGSMMLDPAVIEPVADILRAADFADMRHGAIFAAVTANAAGGADTNPTGVAVTLLKLAELQRVGGTPYLHDLIAAVPTTVQSTWYAQEVAKAARIRAAAVDAIRLKQVADTGDIDAIERIRAELVQSWTTGPVDVTDDVEILTLAERLAREPTPITWRIEDWQPVGTRVILAAQYKAGKTTVTGNSIRCLVDGSPFLDRFKVAPIDGTLALFDVEMSPRQLDDWLRDQRIVNDDRVIVIPLRGAAASLDLLDPAVRARWARRLRARGCRYLILDCLRPVLDALGLDEHRETGRFLVAFDALLYEADVTEATVVHHMGHTGERPRGDSRLRDWPDMEWRLVRQKEDDPASPRFLSAYGRDVEVPETQLRFDGVTRHLTVVGGTRRDAATRAALGDILSLLADEPGLSGRAIQDRLASTVHPRDVVRDAIKNGVRDGWISTEGGSHRAILHFVALQCASARQCATSAPARSCECASALIEKRTAHTHRERPGAPPAHAPVCAVCNYPLDPALGRDVHPGCEAIA